MRARRDPDRLIHAFLLEGQTELADQVYDAVRDHIETTRQRVVIGPWRNRDVKPMLRIILPAAAVLVIAVVGYNLLPRSNTVGPPSPSQTAPPTAATPSPSPALLARGSFTVPDANATELDATGDGASVTGTMTVSDEGGRVTVDLECTRTTDGGLIVIAGTVSDSTLDPFSEGGRAAIILQRGSPVRAGFMFDDAPGATCLAFLEGDIDGDATAGLEPIEGNVELRP